MGKCKNFTTIGVAIEHAQVAELTKAAQRMDCSRSEVIRRALDKYLGRPAKSRIVPTVSDEWMRVFEARNREFLKHFTAE